MPDSPPLPRPQLDAFVAYRYAILTYLDYLGQMATVDAQATREIILRYLDHRKSQGLQSSSLFQATIALRHFYRFLLGSGKIAFISR